MTAKYTHKDVHRSITANVVNVPRTAVEEDFDSKRSQDTCSITSFESHRNKKLKQKPKNVKAFLEKFFPDRWYLKENFADRKCLTISCSICEVQFADTYDTVMTHLNSKKHKTKLCCCKDPSELLPQIEILKEDLTE